MTLPSIIKQLTPINQSRCLTMGGDLIARAYILIIHYQSQMQSIQSKNIKNSGAVFHSLALYALSAILFYLANDGYMDKPHTPLMNGVENLAI